MGTTAYKFDLPLRTKEELRLFLRHGFGVSIPDQTVCPGHTSPWRAFCDAYFARHRVSVWLASRGFGGKSFLLAMLGLVEALTLNCDVTILGGSGEQSKRVHEYMTKAWNYPDAPRHLLASDPLKMETSLRWGNTIKALLASQSSIRGPHPVRLKIDEVDEVDQDLLDAALGQPMSKGGVRAHTVLSSTHHHPDGTMTYALKQAAEKGWGVYQWCMRESMQPHGWLSPEEIELKKTDVTEQTWAIEYELQQPSAEDRAIIPEAVEAMFDPALGTFEGRNGEYIELEPPRPDGEYTHGADWAKSRDWTVISTLRTDCTPALLVAFERIGRKPWPQMVARFDARIQRYGGIGQHDETGLGSVVDDSLTQRAYGVQLVGKGRSDLFSNYINLIEKGSLLAPRIKFMHGEHLYCRYGDLYGSGHPPDSFISGALAAVACRVYHRFAPIGT
jgi:hypothetical protein